MIKDKTRPTAAGSGSIQRKLVTPLMVHWAMMVLLALSFVPAEATTTFIVNETGDDADA